MLKNLFVRALPLLIPGSAFAQALTGSVVDSATRAPLAGVAVLLTSATDSSARQAVITDSAGRFTVPPVAPGRYAMAVRRLGFLPVQRMIDVGGRATTAVEIAMSRVPTLLDTVRAQSDRNRTTPGREFFARHYREGKGFFTSGAEIQLSRMNACDYFGGVPGLAITQTRMGFDSGETMIRCRDGRFVHGARRPTCFNTIVDRRQGTVMLDSGVMMFTQKASGTRYIRIEDVKGIEIYRTRTELPSGDDDFSLLPDQPAGAAVRPQTATQRLNAPPGVPHVRLATMKCGTMLIWTKATW